MAGIVKKGHFRILSAITEFNQRVCELINRQVDAGHDFEAEAGEGGGNVGGIIGRVSEAAGICVGRIADNQRDPLVGTGVGCDADQKKDKAQYSR